MIHMGLLNVIRRMALREKLPIREIARRTGLSRNTVRRYLRDEAAAEADVHAALVAAARRIEDLDHRLDDHAEVYAPGTNPLHPDALWAPELGRTGVLDVDLAGTLAILRQIEWARRERRGHLARHRCAAPERGLVDGVRRHAAGLGL